MKSLLAITLCVFLAACSNGPTTLGEAVAGSAVSLESVLAANPGSNVVVQGVMTRKCPVAGCWFMLSEGSCTVKVDTRDAGFVVIDVPVHTKMIVAGRVTTNGAERVIEATGLRY